MNIVVVILVVILLEDRPTEPILLKAIVVEATDREAKFQPRFKAAQPLRPLPHSRAPMLYHKVPYFRLLRPYLTLVND